VEFNETTLPGVFVITPQRVADDRGFFARTWCARELGEHGLKTSLAQCSISFNTSSGTLRGLHFQASPDAETKIVRVTAGAVFDVIVDLRTGSPTFKRWVGVELTAANRRMVYIPEGLAHGFVTLEDQTEVFYQISPAYVPEAARGVRWNDPAFGIEWPREPRVISNRDREFPDFA
jgi:dTDP-4-dehydrorhamnose 3,5-epimerase